MSSRFRNVQKPVRSLPATRQQLRSFGRARRWQAGVKKLYTGGGCCCWVCKAWPCGPKVQSNPKHQETCLYFTDNQRHKLYHPYPHLWLYNRTHSIGIGLLRKTTFDHRFWSNHKHIFPKLVGLVVGFGVRESVFELVFVLVVPPHYKHPPTTLFFPL